MYLPRGPPFVRTERGLEARVYIPGGASGKASSLRAVANLPSWVTPPSGTPTPRTTGLAPATGECSSCTVVVCVRSCRWLRRVWGRINSSLEEVEALLKISEKAARTIGSGRNFDMPLVKLILFRAACGGALHSLPLTEWFVDIICSFYAFPGFAVSSESISSLLSSIEHTHASHHH